MGALAGCQESGFDESRETQRPLKVQHAMDELTGTKVPGVAERPLTLAADALGDALALGVTPVGARWTCRPYMREQARGVETVPADRPGRVRGAPPRTSSSATKERYEEDYDALRQIAPTVMTEGDNWKLNLRLHGEALGRTNDAERLLVDWDNRVAKVTRPGERRRGVSLVLPAGASSPFGRSRSWPISRPGDGADGGGDVGFESGGQEWVGGGIARRPSRARRTSRDAL